MSERAKTQHDILDSVREKVRQLAHELTWVPERVAAITQELTEVEGQLIAAGASAQDDLEALGALRRALHRVVRFHVEPAISGLQAAAEYAASEEAG